MCKCTRNRFYCHRGKLRCNPLSAFSSFPDTSLFTEGSIVFSFKIRHIPPDPSTLAQPEPPSPMPERTTVAQALLDRSPVPLSDSASTRDMSTGEKADEYRRWDERGREWLYGFVWFEQRRDKGIARGYMQASPDGASLPTESRMAAVLPWIGVTSLQIAQNAIPILPCAGVLDFFKGIQCELIAGSTQKSLVILTHLPFPSLFSAVLYRVAPAFFDHGYSALEAACHSISSW